MEDVVFDFGDERGVFGSHAREKVESDTSQAFVFGTSDEEQREVAEDPRDVLRIATFKQSVLVLEDEGIKLRIAGYDGSIPEEMRPKDLPIPLKKSKIIIFFFKKK